MDNKLKAALFDLDGVVFDTEPCYTTFWGTQCKEFHPETPGLEKAIKGQTLTQIYDKYFNGPLEQERELITRRLDEFESRMPFDYIEGFKAFVESLRGHGVKTAVVTSSNCKKMEAVYARHPEFKALFDEILTAEDFDKSKPDPDCYLKAAKRFGAEAGECIVFEDSFNGLKAGKAAKMKVVGLSTTNPAESIKPYSDMIVADFTGLSYDKCAALVEGK